MLVMSEQFTLCTITLEQRFQAQIKSNQSFYEQIWQLTIREQSLTTVALTWMIAVSEESQNSLRINCCCVMKRSCLSVKKSARNSAKQHQFRPMSSVKTLISEIDKDRFDNRYPSRRIRNGLNQDFINRAVDQRRPRLSSIY